jgi:type IV pilus assembly protein PilV
MLLEALIAILIFSVGILAMIGMQATAIKEVADAKYRSDAAFLANQLIGQLWGDRGALASYAYGGGTPPATPAGLNNWITTVQGTLPGVTTTPPPPIPSTMPQVAVVGTTVTIRIFWLPPTATSAHNYVAISYING